MLLHQALAVVIVLDEAWRERTPEEFAGDWLAPLTEHAAVREVILAGDVARFASVATHPRIHLRNGDADEARHIAHAARSEGIAAVLRLRHAAAFRFPLTPELLDAAIDGYCRKAQGGYFQLDLTDLPYPAMTVEVFGRAAAEALGRGKINLDWVTAHLNQDGSFPVERSNLPMAARTSYLDNPKVEYFSFPRFIALEASRLCNLRCTMCALHSDFIDHSHTETHPKHFHLDKYRWILDQLGPYRDSISVAPQFWGEPFMSPHLRDMILYAEEKGIRLGFTTNGTLWDDDMIDFMIKHKVQTLFVSMDGATRETYEQVRIGASYDKLVHNLHRLIERKKALGSATPYLTINMALFPENRHEQDKMIQDWLGRANMVAISNHCVNNVVPELHFGLERIPCPTLWDAMHINTNGDVIPCCRDSGYEEVMGNAYETPILEIWNNDRYRLFRKKHMLREWMDIPICARCDSWTCRSKRIVRRGDLVIHQFPFYQQIVAVPAAVARTPIADAAAAVLVAVKETSQLVRRTLINLTPLGRKAS
jgi:radical SAM protein with 4Fe4S-binding SPASM domain